jgi:glycosyltransferase involved in cell wall biosynthesis
MRIGIFLKKIPDDLGGAFTFVETVVPSLKTDEKIEWIIFYYGHAPRIEGLNVKFVRLGNGGFFRNLRQTHFSFHRKWLHPIFAKLERALGRTLPFPRGSVLDGAMRRHKVKLMWFPSPEYEWVDCPYIATIWDLEHRVQPYFPEISVHGEWAARDQYFKELLPRASYIITGTEVGKREIVHHYGVSAERVRLLPHPTPAFALKEHPRQAPLSGTHQPYILYPAQFWAHKNHVGLLEALAWVHQNTKEKPHVVFVGSDKGNKKHVAEFAKALRLETQVHFAGFVSRDDLVSLYQNAKVVVYPSLCGPENLPPLEAMAFGVPVVAADIPGSREQLGDAALLAPPLDSKAFGKAIVTALADQSVRDALIQKGRARALRYTGREFSTDLLKIVEEFRLISKLWPL